MAGDVGLVGIDRAEEEEELEEPAPDLIALGKFPATAMVVGLLTVIGLLLLLVVVEFLLEVELTTTVPTN